MLVLFKTSSGHDIAINPEHISWVEYNVVDANGKQQSNIALNTQRANGLPKEILVLGTVKEIIDIINKSGKK